MRRWRYWLLGLAGLVGAVTARSYLRRQHPALDPVADYSSLRSNQWGTKALRDLCRAYGLKVQTWRRSLEKLHSGVRVLCVVNPLDVLSDAEIAALQEWISRGGHLVIAVRNVPREQSTADGPRLTATHAILAWLGLVLKQPETPPRKLMPVAGDCWTAYSIRWLAAPEANELVWLGDTRRVRAYLLQRGVSREALENLPQQAPVRVVGRLRAAVAPGEKPPEGALGLAMTLGEGRIDVLGDANILSNRYLAEADNALLAAAVLLPDAPAQMAFDEYHHGLAASEGVGRVGRVRRTLNAALWALMAALALYVGAGMFRMGRPRAFRADPRRTVGEYVRAVAWIYQRAGMSKAALEMLGRGVRRAWSSRLGVPPQAPPEVFGEAARRRGLLVAQPLEAALKALDEALQAPGVSRDRLVKLAADLAALRREMSHHGRRTLRRESL